MDDYTKIQIEYFQESLDYLEKCIKTLYQIKGINLDSKRFFVRPKLNPQLYLDNNRQIKKELQSLDRIFLMPELGQFFETKVPSAVHIDEFINYAEDSRKWIARQIAELRFPESVNQVLKKQELLNTQVEEKKRFKRGELKQKCKEIAEKLGFEEGETLHNFQIDAVCLQLDKRGYIVNRPSVSSVLRDKLDYRKM